MVYTKEYKEIVSFEYPCYICGNILSRARLVIDHVKRVHGYELPVRHVGHHRPVDPEYEFQNDPNGKSEVVHYACASCWFHCPEAGLGELADHYETAHSPKNIDPTKNRDGQLTGNAVNTSAGKRGEEDAYESAEEFEHIGAAAMDEDDKEGKTVSTGNKLFRRKRTPRGASASSSSGNTEEISKDVLKKLNEITELFKNLLQ